ncbi:MAG: cell wall hydrolase [Hoeflea sp.]|uniref:cell wall hydrolase n=1 Tax=Hoeflea sp. TaxID=1940281 RepID=UPI002730E361|nr:cell wall hydrolase [Hoeflea sp.]MDP2119801.1 cell wall hydrolase [Hoeflea sp.]
MPGSGHPLLSRLSAPVVLGLAAFLLTPTVTSHADMATLLAGSAGGDARWKTALTASPAGSIQAAELEFADPVLTSSIASGAGITLPNGDKIAFLGKVGAADPRPDADRVTRSLKKGRVIAVAPVQPPKDFSAGSVLERQSNLLQPSLDAESAMAFLKPEIRGKELKIANAFYTRGKQKAAPQVPAMLASLVTNDNPDILATAYAPPAPDYAKQSPFSSVLREETQRGRFLPPVEKDDHGWAGTALPPSTFSAAEQRCLAAGIYFEARGESLKGQAAVAQVILNRVRNPTYPDTICGVVYQNESWRNRCQFSFACDGIKDRVRSQKHWNMAEEIALATTAGKIWLKEVGSSTHYHATYVSPPWARKMRKVGKIGLHIFYVTYGGGWS